MSAKVIVTTCTFYPDPTGKDRVRFDLALLLTKLAVQAGHIVVIVDQPSEFYANKYVEEELRRAGANVFTQKEKGMGSSRRQVWQEAKNFLAPDIDAILYTQEKPAIIYYIDKMVKEMKEQKAQLVMPFRKSDGWNNYPRFQTVTERAANTIYNKLFFTESSGFDSMFGPVLFAPSELDYFSQFKAEKYGLPDTYIQHFIPLFLIFYYCRTMVGVGTSFSYPLSQGLEETEAKEKEMLNKRLKQMEDLVSSYAKIMARLLVGFIKK